MKLNPKTVSAEFVNGEDDYTILYLMGSITLTYGTKGKKNSKGVAFKDTNIVRNVAKNLITMADLLDAKKEVQRKVEAYGKIRDQ